MPSPAGSSRAAEGNADRVINTTENCTGSTDDAIRSRADSNTYSNICSNADSNTNNNAGSNTYSSLDSNAHGATDSQSCIHADTGRKSYTENGYNKGYTHSGYSRYSAGRYARSGAGCRRYAGAYNRYAGSSHTS